MHSYCVLLLNGCTEGNAIKKKKYTFRFSYKNEMVLHHLEIRLEKRSAASAQAGFRKGRGTRDQIANFRWIIEKASSRKPSISALLTIPKPLAVWIPINCGKF